MIDVLASRFDKDTIELSVRIGGYHEEILSSQSFENLNHSIDEFKQAIEEMIKSKCRELI